MRLGGVGGGGDRDGGVVGDEAGGGGEVRVEGEEDGELVMPSVQRGGGQRDRGGLRPDLFQAFIGA